MASGGGRVAWPSVGSFTTKAPPCPYRRGHAGASLGHATRLGNINAAIIRRSPRGQGPSLALWVLIPARRDRGADGPLHSWRGSDRRFANPDIPGSPKPAVRECRNRLGRLPPKPSRTRSEIQPRPEIVAPAFAAVHYAASVGHPSPQVLGLAGSVSPIEKTFAGERR